MSIGGRAGNTRDVLPEGSEVAGYRIEATIHRDGFTTDYSARSPGERAPVVVRELFPGFVYRSSGGDVRCYDEALRDTLSVARRRFIEEGRALGSIEAAALPHVFEVDEANNTAYWVLEPGEGRPLGRLLDGAGPADPESVWRVAAAVMDALDRMHGAGILHLDIQPRRVLLNGGEVRLVSGAFARFATHRFNPDATKPFRHAYAALELHAPDEPADPASDIYGLAATLFHLATGRSPRTAPERSRRDDVGDALDAVGDRIGRALVAAIEDGLGLLVEDRPQSVAEWRAAFPRFA